MILSFKKNLMKKLLIVLILSLFVFQSALAFNPFSIIPIPITTDPLPPVPTGDSGLRTKEVGLTVMGITIPGVTLDSLMIFGLRKLIDKLSDDTVKWINGGFNGSPAYATDPESFFKDILNNVGGEFITQIGAGALCSPFQLEIKGALTAQIQNMQSKSRDPYAGSCTLSNVVSNMQQFVNGDFTQGDWDGFYLLTQGKNNNQYSGLIDTSAQLSIKLVSESGVEEARLNWGNGFLSWSECIDPGPGTPAAQCKKRGPTKTPGKVIESQLEKTLGAEVDQLNLADEFDEILSALAGRLMGEVFNTGKGLIDSSKTSGPGWTGGGNGGNVGSSGTCFADKSTAIMGVDTITWTVTVIGGNNPTYSWSGTDGLSGSGQSVQMLYTIPGQKTASVQVSDTIMVNGTPTPRSFTVNCGNKVDVLKYPAIVGTCAPYDAVGNKVFVYKPYLALTWKAQVSGGSGSYSTFVWTGSNPTVKSGDGSGNFITLPAPIDFSPKSTAVPQFSRWYDTNGTQNVDLLVVDTDPTQPPGKITCDRVDILPYP